MMAPDIESVAPLSPIQKGILFESLAAAPEDGVYISQTVLQFKGEFSNSAFAEAWHKVSARHAILRTAFTWQDLNEKVLQVVLRQAPIPTMQEDWRGISVTAQKQRLQEFLDADRRAGFKFHQAPLMRVSLMRTANDVLWFVWTRHHLILDGWSTALVLQELAANYEAARSGHQLVLPEAPHYRSYIDWLADQDKVAAELFWRGEVRGITASTSLPMMRPGAANSRQRDQRKCSKQLHSELVSNLGAVARQHHVTLNTIFQGAWGILLSKYSGERTVLFGATTSGRPAELAEAEGMVGLFINTLPLRVSVKGSTLLKDWLVKLQERQSEARQYEYVSLTDIHSWSEIPRTLSMFEINFVFENYPSGIFTELYNTGFSVPESAIDLVINTDIVHYPLTLTVKLGQGMELELLYHRGRLDDASARQMLENLEVLLEGMAVGMEGSMAELPVIGERQRNELFREWNNTYKSFGDCLLVHELISRQADRTPDAIAATCEQRHITYEQLDSRSGRLARYLVKLGVGLEVRVGLCLDRNLEILIAALAVLKAGGIFVPLEPELPAERLTYMLKDAQVSILLSSAGVGNRDFGDGARLVLLDTGCAFIESVSDQVLQISPPRAAGAYIMYTSGSTGNPKGVLVPHSALQNYVRWAVETYGLGSGEESPVHSSLGFDLTITSLLPPLTCGAVVRMMRRTGVDELAEEIRDCRNAFVKLTPSHLMALTEMGEVSTLAERVRTFVIGGEALSGDSLFPWQEQSPKARIFNEYGPTETVVGSCVFEITQVETGAMVPIGRPIANTRVYLLEDELRPVGAGMVGELFIAGTGVTRGYVNQPALTAERFVPDIFTEVGGGRMYRTGDLARWRPDGTLEYLGRSDSQIKIHGYRIELGEIEAVLAQCPGVQQCVVIAAESDVGAKRLVAYVVGKTKTSEIKEHLQQKLPPYMIPSAFVFLPGIPLTPNGKLDSKALPRPETTSDHAYVAPRTPTQEILAGIWCQILRLDRIGIHDNFFELGGHSLLATQVMSRVAKTFHVQISLHGLFEAPTIAQLALCVERAHNQGWIKEAPPIVPVPRGDGLPLSYGQWRLFFVHQMEPESSAYNVPTAIRIVGPVDISALQKSFYEIVRRHEVLRATFLMRDGEAIQQVAPEMKITVDVVDLTAISSRHDTAQSLAREAADRPFNLTRDPLIRAMLIQLDSDDYQFVVTMHHAVSDDWSVNIILKELTQLYKHYHARLEFQLPELPIQYADFAVWQRQWLTGEALQQQIEYWRRQLASLPALSLPLDYPRGFTTGRTGGEVAFALSAESTASLLSLSHKEGVTLFMTLLAAFQLLLGRYSGQEDFAIGTPIAGRSRPELEELVGFFVNQLVLRADLTGNPTFSELLCKVRKVTLDAYTHQDLPFEHLVQELQPERDLITPPLFQAMLVLQNAPASYGDMDDLTITDISPARLSSKRDLTLYARELEGRLHFWLTYDSGLFTAATAERMAGDFELLLAAILEAPSHSISAYSFISPEIAAEREREFQCQLE